METQEGGMATPPGAEAILPFTRNWLPVAYAALGILAIPIYFAGAGHPVLQALLALALNVAVAIAIVVGIRLHDPVPAGVWWLLGGSQLLGMMAFIPSYVYPVATGGAVTVVSIGSLLYLLSHLLNVLALLRLVQHRKLTMRRGGWLDILMIAIGVGALSVQYVIFPIASGPGSALERAVVLAFPILDLALLALLVGMMLTFNQSRVVNSLLAMSVFSQLVWDNTYSVNAFDGLFIHKQIWFGFQLLAFALLGAAALHPSMRDLGKAAGSKMVVTLTAKRLLLLILIALFPTIIMIHEDVVVRPDLDQLALDILAAALFVLAMLRAADLGVSLTEHQRVLAELEKEVQSRRRIESELMRSNVELEQFAYVASHDLQEPLRMVAGYVQLLARRYRGKLDDDADEFIHYAVDGAVRMQALINDLLTYSRVGTKGKTFVTTDLDGPLDDALGNLSLNISEVGAEVIRGPLPTVDGDPGQLTQLFQNLIGNALKFHAKGRTEIRIAAEPASEMVRVSVADNGIGIEPQAARRIFEVFQRLHTRDEYAGTGIGLAVCKKIVERHGGEIWVESEAGHGARFYFTLRAAETTLRAGAPTRPGLRASELREVSG